MSLFQVKHHETGKVVSVYAVDRIHIDDPDSTWEPDTMLELCFLIWEQSGEGSRIDRDDMWAWVNSVDYQPVHIELGTEPEPLSQEAIEALWAAATERRQEASEE